MTFFVPSIIDGVMNKIALWIRIRENDWTHKRAIIASNNEVLHFYKDSLVHSCVLRQLKKRLELSIHG